MPKLVSASPPTANSWIEKAPMQIARSNMGIAVVSGEIYAMGGDTKSGCTNATEEYDPFSNTWTLRSPMPYPRDQFGTAVIGDQIFCIGGSSYSTNVSELWTGTNQVYNTLTDTWETKAPVPGVVGDIFVTEANVVNGKIYVTGGGTYGNSSYVYDPASNAWTTISPMPKPMNYPVSAVANNKIYYFSPSITQIHNPTDNSWSVGATEPALQLPNQTGQPGKDAWTAAATTGAQAPIRIYVLGSASVFGGVECFNRIYDPQTNTWSIGADVPTDRINFAAAVVNDQLYVIGGYTENEFDFVNQEYSINEQYTPIGYGTITPNPTSTPSIIPTVPDLSWLVIIPLLLSVVAVAVLVKHRKIANLER